ncbi:SURF1 family protein [Pseudonocardia sp. GCM10023141]|uniref:SURF1 family cytochrome oxidase biogenesis protein n=1 Tax=Pseudonocardia sp. GCM10023141 TaxID=3252653 RepID=UPI00360C7D35
MRFLLRPGWLVFVAVVVAFAIACYTLLAPWQFGREAERDAQQHAIDVSYATAPVPLATLSPAGSGVTPGIEWRQVTVTGTYLPDAEALVRLRVIDGKPAFEALTPFRTDDGRLITVDRGYVTAPSGTVIPPFAAAPTGPVTLTARLRVDELDADNRPVFTADGHRQLYSADSRTLAASARLALEPGYLQLAADQPGVLGPLAVTPATGAGAAPFTNFSYALQWLTFGAIALFAMAYFVRLELLQRRGRATTRSDVRRALAGDDDEPAPAPGPATPAGETPLSDRYGR